MSGFTAAGVIWSKIINPNGSIDKDLVVEYLAKESQIVMKVREEMLGAKMDSERRIRALEVEVEELQAKYENAMAIVAFAMEESAWLQEYWAEHSSK